MYCQEWEHGLDDAGDGGGSGRRYGTGHRIENSQRVGSIVMDGEYVPSGVRDFDSRLVVSVAGGVISKLGLSDTEGDPATGG